MTDTWLTIVGMGEDGLDGLAPATRVIVEEAELLVGSERLLALVPEGAAERLAWPTPLDALPAKLEAAHGRAVVVLATGDPMHYGIGPTILKHVPKEEVKILPHLSAFSLAAARLGWSLSEVETLSLHGRDAALIDPHIAPGAHILALTSGDVTVREVARRLMDRGYEASPMVVLEHMGGPAERIITFTARSLPDTRFAELSTLAVTCRPLPGAALLPRIPGLPDEAFHHDGQITKREVRAITLAALAPYPQALLWDVGAGSGSIAIEWMRAVRGARVMLFEQDPTRLGLIAENAVKLGAPSLEVVAGDFLETHLGRERPHALFLGGGVSDPGMLESAWEALKPGGRFVANAVTVEGEARLADFHALHGGELLRIDIAHAAPISDQRRAMRPRYGVTQWRAVKP